MENFNKNLNSDGLVSITTHISGEEHQKIIDIAAELGTKREHLYSTIVRTFIEDYPKNKAKYAKERAEAFQPSEPTDYEKIGIPQI